LSQEAGVEMLFAKTTHCGSRSRTPGAEVTTFFADRSAHSLGVRGPRRRGGIWPNVRRGHSERTVQVTLSAA